MRDDAGKADIRPAAAGGLRRHVPERLTRDRHLRGARAMLGILILSIAGVSAYKNAAMKGRLLRSVLTQCGVIARFILIFFLVQRVLM